MHIVTARAKLNMTLVVGARQADGYHAIESAMHKIDLADTLCLDIAAGGSDTIIRVSDPLCPEGPDNVIHRAVDAWRQAVNCTLSVNVSLTKRIPMGAGLGGGSADAAQIVRALNTHAGRFGVRPLTPEALLDLAASIGSDVPFALDHVFALARGRGVTLERLTPLPSYHVLLIVGRTPSLTAQAYAKLDARGLTRCPIDHDAVIDRLRRGERWECCPDTNSFSDLDSFDALDLIRSEWQTLDALFGGLTGSGSTVFLLFSDRTRRQSAHARLSRLIDARRLIHTKLAHTL